MALIALPGISPVVVRRGEGDGAGMVKLGGQSRRGLWHPDCVREGPIARMRTLAGVTPEILKPPMPISPVPTRILVERLTG